MELMHTYAKLKKNQCPTTISRKKNRLKSLILSGCEKYVILFVVHREL